MSTIIEYFAARLLELGVTELFEVPGDYNFHMLDRLELGPVKCINSTNELNGSYAADGYARVKGASCLITTYGVGELSCVNGYAGMYCEKVFSIHAVGMPSMSMLKEGSLVHHTLADNRMMAFVDGMRTVYCNSIVVYGTAEEMKKQIDDVIIEGYQKQLPVYIGFPTDCVEVPVELPTTKLALNNSCAKNVEAIAQAVASKVNADSKVIALVGSTAVRMDMSKLIEETIVSKNLPFTAYYGDKGVISEGLPNFLGTGNGHILNKGVAKLMEEADLIVNFGAVPSDFHTGGFTLKMDKSKYVDIFATYTDVCGQKFENVYFQDVVKAVCAALPKLNAPLPGNFDTHREDKSLSSHFFDQFVANLREGDIVVVETGSSGFNLAFRHFPAGVKVFTQAIYGSIGWATPASIGAQVAHNGRVLLITGEGSHQLTLQDMAICGRYNIPVQMYVINNDGYLIERMLCKDPEIEYNNIASMKYHLLPAAFGFNANVETINNEAEVDAHFSKKIEGPQYIEVITPRYDGPKYTALLRAELDVVNGRV